ncbi:cation diffusion facilitator family transporter [Zunongwangia pacifica]|uniref:Cation diffusion facilitator family transporter n=1 Tax=Zunongwangia pacifica TaxID=2911062 RepID=A0A9X1ZWW9_9FLAO|nr:cation diffusion facilitator family transporter [Zunongwangia pacifica]MCL6218855.1 cation diffusion facilitator family transporter [Zunongwangia pacifica]
MSHHHHHHNNQSGKNLKIAFFLNLGFTILEFFGGIYVNSVAIMSDAVHDLGDSLSLGTAWYLDKKSKKGADDNYSFGYKRFSLLGALINSIVLIGGSVYVISEAIGRLFNPQPSDAQGMIVFAIFGVLVNGYAAWKLSSGNSLNEKTVSWHLMEDVLGWVAVLIVAIVLNFTDNEYLDPALSILITLYILYNVILRLKETLYIFLQGVPKEIKAEKIKNDILKINNIDSLHHTHIWSLEGEHHVFSSHIKLKDISDFEELVAIKKQVKAILKEYHFDHYTIETELDHESCDLLSNEKQEHEHKKEH